MKTFLHDFRPDELRDQVARKPLILIPIGTIEWHAAHLPLGVDGLLAVSFCRDIAERTGVVVAPPVWFGVCRDLTPEAGYYGTVTTISESTLEGLVADLLEGFKKLGFKQAILFSGHYENEHFGPIDRGMKRVDGIASRFITELTLIEELEEKREDLTETWPFAGDHAGEFETSLILHTHGDLADMSLAPETIELPMEPLPSYIKKRYPRRATAEYGKQLYDAIIEGGVKLVNELTS